MKKNFALIVVAVFSIFFFACEEEAIPIPLPPPLPGAQTADDSALLAQLDDEAADSAADAPEIVANSPSEKKTAPSPAAKPARVKPAPAAWAAEDSEQSGSGMYTIQIAVFPREASARALVKKMADNGIKAYYVRVDNPAKLLGLYYRVRIGFFSSIAEAEYFAKTRLGSLGYAWWVDRRRNDNLGSFSTEPAVVVPEISNDALEEAKQAYKELAKEAIKETAKQGDHKKRVKADKKNKASVK